MSYSPWGGAPPQQQQPPAGYSYPAAGPTPGAYNPYGTPAVNQAPPGVYTPPVASPTQPYAQPYPGAAPQPYAQPAQPYGAPYAQQPYGTTQPTQPAVANPYATAGQAPAPATAQPTHVPAPQKPTQGPPPAHAQEPEMITQAVDCAPGYDLIAATQPRLQGHVPTATMTAHEANVATAIAPQHVQHVHTTQAVAATTTTTTTSASAPPTDILPTAPPVPTENIVPFTFHAAHHHIQTHNQQLYIGHHPLHHKPLKVVCRVVSKDAGQIVFADITGDISSSNPHVVGWDVRVGDVVELYCTAYPQPGNATPTITPYTYKLLTPHVLPEQHAVKMMQDHLATCHAWYTTYAFGAAAFADMVKLKGDAVVKFENPYFVIPLTCAQFNQNIQFDPVTHRAMYGSLDVTNRLVSRCVNTMSVANCTQANHHNPGFSCPCSPSCHTVHLDDGAPLLGTPPVQVAAVHFDPTKPPYCHAPAVGQTIELVSFITATPSQLKRSEKAILLPDPSPTAQQHGGYNAEKLHHHKKIAEDVWRNLQQQQQQPQQPTAAYPHGQHPQYPVQPQQQYPYGAQGQPPQPQQQPQQQQQQQQQQPNVNITSIHITNNTYNHQQNLHQQQPIIAPQSQGGVLSAEEHRAQDIQYRLQHHPHTVTTEERTFITYWTQTHHIVVAPQAHIIEVADGKKAKKEKKFKAKDVKKDKKDGKVKAPKPPKVGKVPKPAGVCYGSSTSDYWTSDSD